MTQISSGEWFKSLFSYSLELIHVDPYSDGSLTCSDSDRFVVLLDELPIDSAMFVYETP